MHCKVKEPIDAMGVMTDKKTRKTEAVDVDTVRIVALHINDLEEIAHITYAIGGIDSNGKFHICPTKKNALAQLAVSGADYIHFFRDPSGNLKMEFPPDLFELLYENGIPSANQLVWGYEEIEANLCVNGKSPRTVLKREKPKKP
jgi:hypothetical protein